MISNGPAVKWNKNPSDDSSPLSGLVLINNSLPSVSLPLKINYIFRQKTPKTIISTVSVNADTVG